MLALRLVWTHNWRGMDGWLDLYVYQLGLKNSGGAMKLVDVVGHTRRPNSHRV